MDEVLPLVIAHGEPPAVNDPSWKSWWPSRVADAEIVVAATQAVITAAAPASPTGDATAWLHLCLEEAIMNAMVHGNEADPNLVVEIAVWTDGFGWTCHISDQGRGFAAIDVPDPTDPGSVILEHGRGIRLMRDWLDDLRYYRSGSCVLLQRRWSAKQSS